MMTTDPSGRRAGCNPRATLAGPGTHTVGRPERRLYSWGVRVVRVLAPRIHARVEGRRRLGLSPVPPSWARAPFLLAYVVLLVVLVPSRSWSSEVSTAEPTPSSAPVERLDFGGSDSSSSTATVTETVTAPGDPVVVTVPGDTVVVTAPGESALDAEFAARVDEALGQLVIGAGFLTFFVAAFVVGSWGVGRRE